MTSLQFMSTRNYTANALVIFTARETKTGKMQEIVISAFKGEAI